MKRLLPPLASALLVFFLAGCGGDGDGPSTLTNPLIGGAYTGSATENDGTAIGSARAQIQGTSVKVWTKAAAGSSDEIAWVGEESGPVFNGFATLPDGSTVSAAGNLYQNGVGIAGTLSYPTSTGTRTIKISLPNYTAP